MDDNMAFCTNCQRHIAASNYVTHNLHCQRNLVKCDKCGEAVPRSALDEHHSELHAVVPCPDCDVRTERTLLSKHKETTCRSRQQSCRYCELELVASEMSEHENYCGSRTKRCEDCGDYVMLKYEQLHLDSNHGFLKLDDEPGPSSQWIKNDIDSIRPINSQSNSNVTRPQLSNGKFDKDKNDDVDDINFMLAVADLHKHPKVWAAPRHGGVAYPVTSAPQRTISPPPPPANWAPTAYNDGKKSDLVALPCEFCDAMIPSDELLLHQTGCQPEIGNFGYQRKQNNILADIKTQLLISESDSFIDVEGDSESDTEIEGPSTRFQPKNLPEAGNKHDYDNTELPCEFCDDGFPPSILLEHQNVCDYNPQNYQDSSPRRDGLLPSTVTPIDSVRKKTVLTKLNVNHTPKLQRINNAALDLDRPRNSGGPTIKPLTDHGSVSVATEWNDLKLDRPSSATGAIPKSKAGKLNMTRQIAQETPSARPTNYKVMAAQAPDSACHSCSRGHPHKSNDE